MIVIGKNDFLSQQPQ